MIDIADELAGYGDEPPRPSKVSADGYLPKGGTVPLADLQATGFNLAPGNSPLRQYTWATRVAGGLAQTSPQMPNTNTQWTMPPITDWHYEITDEEKRVIHGDRCYQCRRYLPDDKSCPDCPPPT